MLNLRLYYQLSTNSKRAMGRSRNRNGMPYTYRPRGHLLERLARENNTSPTEIYNQLLQERRELLRLFGEL